MCLTHAVKMVDYLLAFLPVRFTMAGNKENPMPSCTLGKYDNYAVKEVVYDKNVGKTIVKINPTAQCPDGIFISARTVVQKDSSVSKPTLSFSTKLNAPVVLMPSGVAVVKQVDPTEVPEASHFGFFSWVLVLALIAGAIYVVRKFLAEEVDEPSSANPAHPTPPEDVVTPDRQSTGHQTARRSRSQSSKPTRNDLHVATSQPVSPQTAPQQAPAPVQHTTVINTTTDFRCGVVEHNDGL